MTPTRPTSITVIAILQLVFGGLAVLGLICGGIWIAAGGQALLSRMGSAGGNAPANKKVADQMKMQEEFQAGLQKAEAALPGGKTLQYALVGIDILLTVLLIVTGIGLLKMRPWSHSVTIFYAGLSILMKVVSLVFAVLYGIPAASAFLKEFGSRGDDQQRLASLGQIGLYVAYAQPVVLAIYPMIVLIIMLLPRNRAAFRPQPNAPMDVSPASENIEAEDRWGQG